jgi:hypothetical protein
MTNQPGEASRWMTAVGDAFGLVAVIWSIPLAIVVIGAPIALIVMLIKMAAQSIFG